MKQLLGIYRSDESHWVGDGFPVRTIFSYNSLGTRISPFLMLDYAGPAEFAPSDRPRGVGQHPHRGFETVTIAYQGEVEHRDSAGNAGRIGPGDIQWMTAAAGVLHEEMHSREFTQKGGTFEMIQLWVNLPARLKMSAPRYQALLNRDVPAVQIANGAGIMRVIAGSFQGTKGPAKSFTPINLWDLRLKAGHRLDLSLPLGYTTAVFLLKGTLTVNESEKMREAELALFDRSGEKIVLEAKEDVTALILNGEPIDEPIAGYGPFVMNTRAELQQAQLDYQNGTLGRRPA